MLCKLLASTSCPFFTTMKRLHLFRRSFNCELWRKSPQTCAQHTLSASPNKSLEFDLPSAVERPSRTLSTLTPSLLTESDYVDLSGSCVMAISFPLSTVRFPKPSTPIPSPRPHLPAAAAFRLYYEHRNHRFMPFPTHSHGFLYFGPQPGLPNLPIAASLRFRCTPTAHPSSFDDGYDLLLPNGLPWQRLLAQAAMAVSPVLRKQLLLEQLTTPHLLRSWRQRLGLSNTSKAGSRRLHTSQMLFRLQQRFPIDFGRSVKLMIITRSKVYRILIPDTFVDRFEGRKRHPFTGSAIAHFEHSPSAKHILHLRIVKLLQPVAVSDALPDGQPRGGSRIVWPREGELFSVRIWDRQSESWLAGEEPWAINLRGADTHHAKALRLLAFPRGMPPQQPAPLKAVPRRCALCVNNRCRQRLVCPGRGGQKLCSCGHPPMGKGSKTRIPEAKLIAYFEKQDRRQAGMSGLPPTTADEKLTTKDNLGKTRRCALCVKNLCRKRLDCPGKGGHKFCLCGHPPMEKGEKARTSEADLVAYFEEQDRITGM
ncbi:hypothetical protein DFH07DRAFT_802748 [Mycena maculata]|uniref:Uncharacterized protein n=1 Tax=Mycena maculata TaxID=230809 RepID=A0AAD7JVI6_9AGAR|nr:hypothetical protein DFH07DRAFT_802748 [Mycena maculata]